MAGSAPPGWSAISAGRATSMTGRWARPGSTARSGWHGRRDRTRTPARTSAPATGSRSPSRATRAGPSAPLSPCPPTAATPRSACGSHRCQAGPWPPGPAARPVVAAPRAAAGPPRQPERALTGDGPPLDLPGATFYDFPAGDIAALPDGKLVVAAPFWAAGRSVIKGAAGVPGARWQQTSLNPPAGADLLLPALGVLSPGGVRLLCAVHTRSGDRLGYDWTDVTVTGQDPAVRP